MIVTTASMREKIMMNERSMARKQPEDEGKLCTLSV